jgi:Xaa-Pro aminopeptidase
LLYYDNKANNEMNIKLNTILSNAKNSPQNMSNSASLFNELKAFKSDAEIEMLRRSAEISSFAFCSAMRCTKPGMSESHIEAILEFESRLRGAQRLAYPPVVASGNNANTMHYVQNSQIMKDGDLLLIDAGCEYYQYPSDISRTWPVNGKFSTSQRDLYEAVLRVQKKCIEKCKPGMDFTSLQRHAVNYIAQELVDLKICNSSNILSVIEIFFSHKIDD